MHVVPIRRPGLAFVVAGLVALPACGWHYGYNFLDPAEPRFAPGQQRPAGQRFQGRVKLVSFNIKFGEPARTARAIQYLQTDPTFGHPDVLLLQEVNCEAVEAIAAGLQANWVYYPAAWHPKGTQWTTSPSAGSPCPPRQPAKGGYFGVGIVTPWTIADDQKIPLPQVSRSDAAQKVALAATIDFGGAYRLRAINVHLQYGLSPVQMGDQVQVITQCVLGERCPPGARVVPLDSWAHRSGPAGRPGNVIVAGDFNSPGEAHIQVVKTLLAGGAEPVPLPAGTYWLLSAFSSLGRLDHVFHGVGLRPGEVQVGTRHVSDHRPVMVEFTVEEGAR